MARATEGLPPQDRALAHALAAETLRWLVDLDQLIDSATARPLPVDAKARSVLRLALVQSLVLGTPGHAAIATALPPSWVQHTRPVFAHVGQRLQPGDRVYVYPGAELAFAYYGPRSGITTDRAVVGRCSLGNPREYFHDLDRLRGQGRVWFVATHEQWVGEMDLILGYMDQIGRRVDEFVVPASNRRVIENAYGYLYDLSRRDGRPTVSADAFPIPSSYNLPSENAARWGCYGITGGAPRR